MISVKVETKGLIATGKAGPPFFNALKDAYRESGLMLEGEVSKRSPVNTGKLRKSIASEVRGSGFGMYGRVSSPLEYGTYVEEGQKPRATLPPFKPIHAWVKKKIGVAGIRKAAKGRKIKPATLLKRLTFAVMKKIAAQGVTAANMFRDTFKPGPTLAKVGRIFQFHIDKFVQKVNK